MNHVEDDVRRMFEVFTRRAPAGDPVPAVRARVRARRRRRIGAGGALATVGLVGSIGVASALTDRDGPEGVTGVTTDGPEPPAPEPSTGSEADLDDRGFGGVGRLVEANPDAFVGSYVDAAGTAVVVLGPEARQAEWEPRVREAAGGRAYRFARCTRSHRALAATMSELDRFDWPSGRIAVAYHIDAASCSVRVISDQIRPADLTALSARFGDAVTVDPTGHPTRR